MKQFFFHSVSIPTRQYSPSLVRCVKSVATRLAEHGRAGKIVVRSDHAEDMTFQLLREEIKRQFGVLVELVGPTVLSQWCNRLVQIGLRPSLADLLLKGAGHVGEPYGASRNGLLLANAGHRYVQVDDDVVVETLSVAVSQEPTLWASQLEGYAHYSPNEYWSFRDMKEVTEFFELHRSDKDFLEEHEAFLGRSLASLSSGAMLGEAERRLDGVLAPHKTVVATQNGSIGDLGWYSPTWLMFEEGESRKRLMPDDETYQRAIRSRLVLRSPRSPTISEGRFFQSMSLGLDARTVIPFFVPTARYEDGAFRALMAATGPRPVAHLSSAVLHLPENRAGFDAEAVWRTGAWVRWCEWLVQIFIGVGTTLHSSGDSAFHELGTRILELCDSPERLKEFSCENLRKQKRLYVAHLEGLLARYEGPSNWRRDMMLHFAEVSKTIDHPERMVPRELIDAGVEDGWKVACQQLRDIGELTLSWPEVFREFARG